MYAIVILVGGKGSRVSKLLKGKSKPEIEILPNIKIVDFQIKNLVKLNKKIIFLSNVSHSSFRKHIETKYKNYDIDIIEESKPLGTGGSLAQLKKYKYKFFLIIDGDLIFNINFKKLVKYHKLKKSNCTLVVHPNNHPHDSDCLKINTGSKIEKFFLKPHRNININNLCLSGIKMINKNCLNILEDNKYQDFSKIFLKKLIKKKTIYAYNTREYIKDVGTPNRIKEFKREYRTIKFKKANIDKKIPAIFIDKDGVINFLNKKKNYQDIKKIMTGVINSLKLINESGYLAIMITNQPAVAKGFISENKLKNDLCLLSSKLGQNNVFFDRIYYCPHHPEKGHKYENKKFKIICNCRKPKNGLFLKAIKELNIDVTKSYMIGDQISDYIAAKKTKIKFIGISNDVNVISKKITKKQNILDAVKYILN
tara:strand:- start:36235 stop:37506 length:1272 start_codon:yes stop_codon:yes gene_type:complete